MKKNILLTALIIILNSHVFATNEHAERFMEFLNHNPNIQKWLSYESVLRISNILKSIPRSTSTDTSALTGLDSPDKNPDQTHQNFELDIHDILAEIYNQKDEEIDKFLRFNLTSEEIILCENESDENFNIMEKVRNFLSELINNEI